MCTLYTQTTAHEAMVRMFQPVRSFAGNLGPTEVYPDRNAPIIKNGPLGREMIMGRRGMPTPPQFIKGKADRGVVNIRNTASPHWRRWLGPDNRCLVPFDGFAEPGPGGTIWFELSDKAKQGVFAGLWTEWTSIRKVKDGESTDQLFGFLTCPPNAEVASVHPKAMPVILTDPEDWEIWLRAPWEIAKNLQRPLPDSSLRTV